MILALIALLFVLLPTLSITSTIACKTLASRALISFSVAEFYSSADNLVGLIQYMKIFEQLGLSKLAETRL